MAKNTKVAEAVKVLSEALKNDPELKEVWKANIAMSIFDVLEFIETKPPEVNGAVLTACVMSKHTAHKKANAGAEAFLNLLIYTGK